jgi:hypothetical protein
MKPRIVLGITTYRDLRSAEIGAMVYDAFAEASPRLAPTRASVWQQHHVVGNRDEFAAHWHTELAYQTREHRGTTAAVLERGRFQVGAHWRTTGALNGRGEVAYRPETDNTRPDELRIDHAFSPRVDWYGLLRRLVEVTAPAYAMLHAFNVQGSSCDYSIQPDAFSGALTGEARFVSWKTPAGTWRKPDSWERAERRRYRHLPDLPWANYLGPEFSGRVDPSRLRDAADESSEMGEGILLRTTSQLADVLNPDTDFSARQSRLKRAFADGTFHAA